MRMLQRAILAVAIGSIVLGELPLLVAGCAAAAPQRGGGGLVRPAPAPAPAAEFCPGCGARAQPGDQFCGSCGASLAAPGGAPDNAGGRSIGRTLGGAK